VSPPETATDATRRLEMRLGDFGIPRKFIDEFTGHHTVSTTTRALWSFCRARQQTVMFWPGQRFIVLVYLSTEEKRVAVLQTAHLNHKI